jgi:hypothetical protein
MRKGQNSKWSDLKVKKLLNDAESMTLEELSIEWKTSKDAIGMQLRKRKASALKTSNKARTNPESKDYDPEVYWINHPNFQHKVYNGTVEIFHQFPTNNW